jgi:hypothetical protein
MSTTLNFKKYLTEAISSASADKAAFLIAKYLKKKSGLIFFRYPGLETFKNAKGRGFGMRFYSSKKSRSIRFNWKNASAVGMVGLHSIDYWDGISTAPWHIEFDTDVSLVKTLPIVASIISNVKPELGTFYTLPDGVPLEEAGVVAESTMILEAKGGVSVEEMLDGILDMITMPNFSKGKVHNSYRSAGVKIFDQLEMMYPTLIIKSGTKYTWDGTPKDFQKIKKDKGKILAAIGSVEAKVTKGSSNETYEPSGNIVDIENNRERLSFEKQLLDLENLLKLTITGTANAIFISGSGGVGKTFTTEKILSSLGLRDGAGYFKNTGVLSNFLFQT